MANPIQYLDELLQRLGGYAGYRWGTVEPGRRLADYPKIGAMLRDTPMSRMPEPGTAVYAVDPHALIGAMSYPDGLASEARRRLRASPYQRPPDGQLDWLYLRPGDETVERTPGRTMAFIPKDPSDDGRFAVYDVASQADGAIPTLVHELRHGINTYPTYSQRALPTVSRAYRQSVSADKGPVPLRVEYQQYLARPSEMLSYVSEAGDDFVGLNKRLVESPTDANEAIAMWAENTGAMADPAVKGFYERAYTQSPAVRKKIQDMLMKYYAVPVATGAASQYDDER